MKSQVNEFPSLRESVRAYDISFTIQLGEVEIRRRVVEASFLLHFGGRHDGYGNCGGAPCPACIGVLRTLLGVADAIQPVDHQTLPQPRYVREKRIYFASAEGREREVALGLEIRVRRPFGRATNGWALAFMEDMSAALIEEGCLNREDAQVADSRSWARPVENERTGSDEARTSTATRESESLLSA
jgi:hypothetical protein